MENKFDFYELKTIKQIKERSRTSCASAGALFLSAKKEKQETAEGKFKEGRFLSFQISVSKFLKR